MVFILPYRRSHLVAAFGSVSDGIVSIASVLCRRRELQLLWVRTGSPKRAGL
jgi:hypothetical protein